MLQISRRLVAVLLIAGPLGLGACRGKPPRPPSDGYDPASTFVQKPGAEMPPPAAACAKVEAEDLRARKAVVNNVPSTPGPGATRTITRAVLWSDFKARCGQASCHGTRSDKDPGNPTLSGRFTMSEESFSQRPTLGTEAYASITTSDTSRVMPPTGIDGSMRPADDAFRLLGEYLQAWQEAGFPDEFQVQTKDPAPRPDPTVQLPDTPYQLSAEVGSSLTNIGSCLPQMAKLEVRADEARRLDDLFASAQTIEDLPETLVETDLISLDSQVLAERGVFSYAPTYTLFSDNAAKMRYVRVPLGQKVKYNPATSDFDIPANTRFYKTFLRKVVDKNGEVGYRKMETRLILSRPDKKLEDGRYQVTSLMVVYAWDKDEMMARKVTDPLQSLEPWSDRLCPYVYDERESRTVQENPFSPQVNLAKCTYMTEAEMKDLSSGKVRHYAIPSQERCVQCHMGSQNHSFILGFTPWHVDRRPKGQGGVYEDAHPDELDQLQRLIDYGVIEGIQPGQAKLEESQGDRKPRNDYELTAQAYMMGNCSFCHNPTGFPTVENPILKDFDLYPSPTGGAFQFSLEKYSARAKVGPLQDLRHPYITPALGDFAPADGFGNLGHLSKSKSYTADPEHFPTNDWLPLIGGGLYNDPSQNVEELNVATATFKFLGPWRSLIWRNVYTPFTYEEDNTIFIHMPRNVPGFDCRAQMIMAEWMLSIPSVPKLYKPPAENSPTFVERKAYQEGVAGYEQPFQEVKPGDLPYANADELKDILPVPQWKKYNYEDARADAERRLALFRGGLTGQHCPTDGDIIDAAVVNSKGIHLAPIDTGRLNGPRVNPAATDLRDEVPDHAHWVVVDTTDPPGRWTPRRIDWKEILVDRDPSIPITPKVKKVIDELQTLYLTPERERFSTELVPMGLWSEACRRSQEAAGAKTILQLRAEEDAAGPKDMHRWLFERDGSSPYFSGPLLSAPVHYQSRGEAVFRGICMNCHGREIDSKSPLAATILELTGGETGVANFRDGVFGPVAAAGQYAEAEFARAGRGGTPADWLARYMVFMGMGGTQSVIPSIALKLVSTSPFYGTAPSTGEAITDANMLESARSLCRDVARASFAVGHATDSEDMVVRLVPNTVRGTVFPPGTGYYELWAGLCSFENLPLVRVFHRVAKPPEGIDLAITNYDMFVNQDIVMRARDAQGRWVYPTDHPVGTFDGRVERGIQPSNRLPWCVLPSSEDDRQLAINHFKQFGIANEADMPFCPKPLVATAFGKRVNEVAPTPLNPDLLDDWTRTGAINAGVAAYYYLDGFTKGKIKPQTAFDECKK